MNPQWAKELVFDGKAIGAKTIQYNHDSDHLTITTLGESLLLHTDADLNSCVVNEIDLPVPIGRKLMVKQFIVKSKETEVVLYPVEGKIETVVLTRELICDESDEVLDIADHVACLLYTSPSPRDATLSRMPSSA